MGEDRKDQCLDWLLVRGRRHLERVLRAYVSHYNVTAFAHLEEGGDRFTGWEQRTVQFTEG